MFAAGKGHRLYPVLKIILNDRFKCLFIIGTVKYGLIYPVRYLGQPDPAIRVRVPFGNIARV